MVGLRDLADRRGLAIVEDACQAHGATRDGILAGSGGTAGAFSFYAAKNLGAMGDAGALVTDDAEIAERMRSLREHGQREKYMHEREGYTSRLDTIQAAVLLRKLPHLTTRTRSEPKQRRRMTSCLPASRVSRCRWCVRQRAGVAPVRRADARPGCARGRLRERRIGTGRHYPVPPHLTEAYASLGFGAGSFPVAEALSERALSLPMFPGSRRTSLRQLQTACGGTSRSDRDDRSFLVREPAWLSIHPCRPRNPRVLRGGRASSL